MSLTSQAWKKAWNLKAFRSQFIVSLLVLASFAWIFNWFFDFAEGRTGTKLQDPFLELLPVRNVSWTVFFFLYMGILIALYCNWSKPKLLLLALQTYVLVTFNLGWWQLPSYHSNLRMAIFHYESQLFSFSPMEVGSFPKICFFPDMFLQSALCFLLCKANDGNRYSGCLL